MTRLRRALGPLTALWLTCQIGTVASAPVALWLSAAEPHAAECTCGHGADAMCPMHHHTPAGDPNSRCSMRAANDTGAAVLMTIVGAPGLLPESTLFQRAADASMRVSSTDVDIRGERPVPPDPPPPRA